MGNTSRSVSPSTLKIPKPDHFDGDKKKFMEWYQHIQMYWTFNRGVSDKQKVLITCQLMKDGPAGSWSDAYCMRELLKSEHDPSHFSWKDFVEELKTIYGPLNIFGDAQA
ncbi:hypothetical protein F5I97DRAFT_1946363 [Phlebopus sp. FC_14]|nr:hypothetical protein F5I97DRAFT_1946363 [Phlebopus sp. FC_14]